MAEFFFLAINSSGNIFLLSCLPKLEKTQLDIHNYVFCLSRSVCFSLFLPLFYVYKEKEKEYEWEREKEIDEEIKRCDTKIDVIW